MIVKFLNYIPRIWIFVGLASAENLKNEYIYRWIHAKSPPFLAKLGEGPAKFPPFKKWILFYKSTENCEAL